MDDSRIRYQAFGQRIQVARLALGLSRKEVAEYIGVQPTFYRRVERGIALLALQTFASLWHRLQFDADTVLDALPVETEVPAKRSRQSPRSRLEHSGQHAGFGRILSRARIDAHITQQALANAIGVQRRHIASIEGGHSLLSLARFAQLRRVLHFDAPRLLNSLLGDDGPGEPFRGFGDTVRVARAGLALAPGDVAEVVGCTLDRYHQIERGVVLPSMQETVYIHQTVQFDVGGAIRWVWESGAIEKMGDDTSLGEGGLS